jgi:cytoskeletal protein RodZ
MNESLGERLRLAREQKGLELKTIADSTRIPLRTLVALEADDISTLPGGGYSRGVIRYFAKEVGLDPSEAVKLFEKQFGRNSNSNELNISHEESDERASRRLFSNLSIGLIFVSAVVVGATLYYFKTAISEPESQVSDSNSISEPSPFVAQTTATPIPTPDSLSVEIQSKSESVTLSVSVDSGVEETSTISAESSRKVSGEESITIGFLGKTWEAMNLKLGERSVSLPSSTLQQLEGNYVIVTIRKEDLPRIVSEGNIDKSRIVLKRLRRSGGTGLETPQTTPTNSDETRKTEEQSNQASPSGGDR